MLKIGLTGGMGSGKSTVATELQKLGAVLIDADKLARELTVPGAPILSKIAEIFGADVVVQGSLQRDRLATLVFGQPEQLAKLESLLHPLIAQRTAALYAAAVPKAIVVHDLPLLVEQGRSPEFHLVIVVTAAEQLRISRIVSRSALTREEVRRRIARQAAEHERVAAADILLENQGSLHQLHADIGRLWHQWLLPFSAALAGEAPAGTGPMVRGSLKLQPYAQLLAARIQRALAAVSIAGTLTQVSTESTIKSGASFELVLHESAGARLGAALAEIGFFAEQQNSEAAWYTSVDPARPARLSVRGPRVHP